MADPADDGADALVWTGGDVDLTEADLAIGSKDSPEQELLGWVAVEAAVVLTECRAAERTSL